MYDVEISKESAKYYKKVDAITRSRINKALNIILLNPKDTDHYDIKPLRGILKGLWRYRVGNIRIIYRINNEKKKVQIVTIRPRGEVYR